MNDEQAKLLATALNTAATSCFTVGIATPLAAVFYNLGNIGATVGVGTLVVGIALWLFAAVALHLAARRILKRFDRP